VQSLIYKKPLHKPVGSLPNNPRYIRQSISENNVLIKIGSEEQALKPTAFATENKTK
jgi:hypothetical protein